MKEMYERKKRFVENELSSCLKVADCDVVRLVYSQVFGEENVIIHFVGGGTRAVNVTGDSHAAIIRDVMRKGGL